MRIELKPAPDTNDWVTHYTVSPSSYPTWSGDYWDPNYPSHPTDWILYINGKEVARVQIPIELKPAPDTNDWGSHYTASPSSYPTWSGDYRTTHYPSHPTDWILYINGKEVARV